MLTMEEQKETFSLWGCRFHATYSPHTALASMPGVYIICWERVKFWRVIDVDE